MKCLRCKRSAKHLKPIGNDYKKTPLGAKMCCVIATSSDFWFQVPEIISHSPDPWYTIFLLLHLWFGLQTLGTLFFVSLGSLYIEFFPPINFISVFIARQPCLHIISCRLVCWKRPPSWQAVREFGTVPWPFTLQEVIWFTFNAWNITPPHHELHEEQIWW